MPSAIHLVPHAQRPRHHVGQAMVEPPPQGPALFNNVSPRITMPIVFAFFVGFGTVYVAALLGSKMAWQIGGAAGLAMLGYGYATKLGTGWVNVPPTTPAAS